MFDTERTGPFNLRLILYAPEIAESLPLTAGLVSELPMKQRSILLAAGAAIAAAVANSGSASVVYQSTPALNGGSFACSDCGGDGSQSIDPFTLSSSANITGVDVVSFSGLFDGQIQIDGLIPFTVNVYSNRFPLTPVFSQSVTTTLVSSGSDYVVVHANLTGLHLTGGHQYWLSFHATPLAIGVGAGNNNGAILVDPNGNQLLPYNGNLEYALLGTVVPEPSTWTMLILGVAMIGASTRRRMKRIVVKA